jgi:hypothetical protein
MCLGKGDCLTAPQLHAAAIPGIKLSHCLHVFNHMLSSVQHTSVTLMLITVQNRRLCSHTLKNVSDNMGILMGPMYHAKYQCFNEVVSRKWARFDML